MIKLVHGGDIYSARERIEGEIVDFSANLNPLVCRSRSGGAGKCDGYLLRYPDPICRELVEQIAENEQVARNIFCAAMVRPTLFSGVWAMRPHTALVAVPTFAEYQQALTACGCKVEQLRSRRNTALH